MIVVGVDPGYDRLGVAVLDSSKKDAVLYSSCIETSRQETFEKRLLYLGDKLIQIFNKWEPDSLAVEKLYIQKNKKTAARVSEVRGMIIYLAVKNNIDLTEYTPLEIKSTITGYGKADKKQVSDMVSRLVKLPKIPTKDDEYDAIAAALTHLAKLSTNSINKD